MKARYFYKYTVSHAPVRLSTGQRIKKTTGRLQTRNKLDRQEAIDLITEMNYIIDNVELVNLELIND